MPNLFQNKYRIQSSRLRHWDYGWNASYFVTICTQNRHCFFGNVTDGIMDLNYIGKIANDCWMQIPNHFPFVKLGNHVVMPNHVHGIIIIDKQVDGYNDERNEETQNFASLPMPTPPTPIPSSPDSKPKNQFGPQSKNLASIIRGYKIGVTTNSRLINPNFAWQPRYHDHIIRNDESFQRISEYIKNNPMNWSSDKFR